MELTAINGPMSTIGVARPMLMESRINLVMIVFNLSSDIINGRGRTKEMMHIREPTPATL